MCEGRSASRAADASITLLNDGANEDAAVHVKRVAAPVAKKPKFRTRTKSFGSTCNRKRRKNSSLARSRFALGSPDRNIKLKTLNAA
jgi:hypothetical protein